MSKKKPLLYAYLTDSGDLADLENLIYANLAFIEDMEITRAVGHIYQFYQSLDRRSRNVSGDDLRLIVMIYYSMHNSLVRIIRKRLILDYRELIRTRVNQAPLAPESPTVENPEEEIPSAAGGESKSGGESKLPDTNSFLLNSLDQLEKLPDSIIGSIREFAGEDGLSPGVKVAAIIDLQILRNLRFLLNQLIPMYEMGGLRALNGLRALAERIDELIANYAVLGLDTSAIQGSAIVVGTRKLRF